MQRERIQHKLGEIFTSLEIDPKNKNFYTFQFPNEQSPSLIVFYNAGLDPDPTFSGPNTGRLYLNANGDFCLTQWSLAQEVRTEVLLKHVTALEWEMLGERPQKAIKCTPIGDFWAWHPVWTKEQKGVPGIIRLKLWCGVEKKKKMEPNLQFAFILPPQEPIQILK